MPNNYLSRAIKPGSEILYEQKYAQSEVFIARRSFMPMLVYKELGFIYVIY
jgi:hypothetical protein